MPVKRFIYHKNESISEITKHALFAKKAQLTGIELHLIHEKPRQKTSTAW
jgi:hypothetical protein